MSCCCVQGISNEVEQYFGVNKFQLGRLLRARLQKKLRIERGECSLADLAEDLGLLQLVVGKIFQRKLAPSWKWRIASLSLLLRPRNRSRAWPLHSRS